MWALRDSPAKTRARRALPYGSRGAWGGLVALFTCGSPQEVIVPEGKWRKVSPASLSLSLPDADYQCIHRTSVSSLSTKESFTSEEPLASGEGCARVGMLSRRSWARWAGRGWDAGQEVEMPGWRSRAHWAGGAWDAGHEEVEMPGRRS